MVEESRSAHSTPATSQGEPESSPVKSAPAPPAQTHNTPAAPAQTQNTPAPPAQAPALATGETPPTQAHALPPGAAATELPAGAAATELPAGAPATEPPADPGFLERGGLRRRLRFLRKTRELAYRDLGGLLFELHRLGQQRDDLVQGKLVTLGRIDSELRAIEDALHERRGVTVLREAGVTACPRCAAIHGSEDRFCPACGFSMGRAERPIAANPVAAPVGTPAQAPPTPPLPATPRPNPSPPSPPPIRPPPAAPAAAPVSAHRVPVTPPKTDQPTEIVEPPTQIVRPGESLDGKSNGA
jgi:hypothetical protein